MGIERMNLKEHKYGKLKVLEYAGNIKRQNMWKCECRTKLPNGTVCGNVSDYSLGNLRSGRSTRCRACGTRAANAKRKKVKKSLT